jgi:hypothetical protein
MSKVKKQLTGLGTYIDPLSVSQLKQIDIMEKSLAYYMAPLSGYDNAMLKGHNKDYLEYNKGYIEYDKGYIEYDKEYIQMITEKYSKCLFMKTLSYVQSIGIISDFQPSPSHSESHNTGVSFENDMVIITLDL